MTLREELLKILKSVEEPDFTFVEKDFPPVFTRAEGIKVYDSEGNEYLDFSSFFGVSFTGHSQSFVKGEAEKGFYHGLGDLIPSEEKILLMKKLSGIIGEGYKGILSQNGSDAVEACLRSAFLYKESRKIIAFEGAYHGTSLGVLSATYSNKFRKRFEKLLPFETKFFQYSVNSISEIRNFLKNNEVSAIIIEPVQGRAGIRIAEKEFLLSLKKLSEEFDLPLIFDEVFTGFGKTGEYFAKDYFGIKPDLIAFGKALSGAFPLSGCFGKERIMNLWGESKGEASFTFTFSGSPFFSRVALRNLEFLEKLNFRKKVREIENLMKKGLSELKNKYKNKIKEVRGIGAIWGIELYHPIDSFIVFKKLLNEERIITLPSGEKGETIEVLPPVIVKEIEINKFINSLEKVLETL